MVNFKFDRVLISGILVGIGKILPYVTTYIPKWLAIANEVRTAIVHSDKIIFIPELSFSLEVNLSILSISDFTRKAVKVPMPGMVFRSSMSLSSLDFHAINIGK